MNRQMLVDFVELLGYECRETDNGTSGMELIRSWLPDTILLDNQMMGMSGLDVIRHVGQDEELRHIPIIMISGTDDLDSVTRVLESGPVDFLSKPFNPAILKARLSSSLERKRLRDRERELLRSLEKSYRDLRKAEAGRDALTHMIVHDLGNPLSVIKMNAEMMQMTTSMGMELSGDALVDRLSHISSAAASMDLMIRSMLDVSKMEAGQLEPSLEPVDVSALLEEVRGRFTVVGADAGVDLRIEACASNTVRTDRVLLERMLANLLSNAFKYAEGASEVVLSASSAKEYALITVADDGSGIPVALQERIFDKFFQVESREGGSVRAGVGLGLAFCRMAAEVLGGSIRVEDNTPRGSRFVIALPA